MAREHEVSLASPTTVLWGGLSGTVSAPDGPSRMIDANFSPDAQ